jgi:site-specific recombinase XerD
MSDAQREPEKLTKSLVEGLEPRTKPYDARDPEVKGFLVRVHPTGSKAFYFDYRLPGWPASKRARYRLGSFPGLSADGARRLAKEAAGDVTRSIDPQARRKAERTRVERARHATLKAFLDDRYEPWARLHLKSASFQLARIRSDFAEWLGEPLTKFDMLTVEGIRQKWKKGGMQPRSINRDIQRLQSVLARAVEWEVLDRHPFKGLKPLKADKTGRVRFLTAAEEAALRAALEKREERLRTMRANANAWRRGHNGKRGGRRLTPLPERHGEFVDHLRPLVLVALNTGLRRGELLGLTWDAVNFPAKLLTVTAATAKSGHTRRVPLNPQALAALETWWQRQGKAGSHDFVFAGRDGKRMTRIDTSWGSLMKSAGLQNFRLHDCRHHFASKLVQAGVDLYTVKELLGHSEIAMTERYSHLAPDNLRRAVEAI